MACCMIHNMMRNLYSEKIFDDGNSKLPDDIENLDALEELAYSDFSEASGETVHNVFAEYFCSDSGKVSWQDHQASRTE